MPSTTLLELTSSHWEFKFHDSVFYYLQITVCRKVSSVNLWHKCLFKYQPFTFHLQLGFVVFPCFVKRLLYVLQKHRRRRKSISKLQSRHLRGGVICSKCLTPPFGFLHPVPQTRRVHDPVPHYTPPAQHKASVYFFEIYRVIF